MIYNKIIKRLFCEHNYEYLYEHFIECGMGKIKYYKCSKCGKIKTKVI